VNRFVGLANGDLIRCSITGRFMGNRPCCPVITNRAAQSSSAKRGSYTFSGTTNGFRYLRVSMALASSSLMNCCLTGSKSSDRPRR